MIYPNSDKETSAPAAEPVSTAEAKTHLRIDHTDEDTYIGTLVTTARLSLEAMTRRAFVTQTRVARYDSFPAVFEHHRSPLQSVSSIAYIDTAGASQTLSASLYSVDTYTEPGRVIPAYGESWPSTRIVMNAVTETYIAGYGAAAAVPENVKHCIKRLLSHWYEFREPMIVGTIVSRENMPWGDVQSLIATFDTGVYA